MKHMSQILILAGLTLSGPLLKADDSSLSKEDLVEIISALTEKTEHTETDLVKMALSGLETRLEESFELTFETAMGTPAMDEQAKVEIALVGDSLAHVKLSHLTLTTVQKLRQSWEETYPNDGPGGLILDLRGVKGDSLAAAQALISLFPTGRKTPWTQKNSFSAQSSHPVIGPVPMTCLVAESTAAAGQQVAEWFQSLGMGLVLGEKSVAEQPSRELIELTSGQRVWISGATPTNGATPAKKVTDDPSLPSTKPDLEVARASFSPRSNDLDPALNRALDLLKALNALQSPAVSRFNR